MRPVAVVCLAALLLGCAAAARPRPHVYLVVIDGLGSDAVDRTSMPRLTDPALCSGGVGEARAVMPTRTNPNHATLLTGALPESHGITGNGHRDPASGAAQALDHAGQLEMETLFTVAAGARPRVTTAAAFSKAKLGRLLGAVPERQHGPDLSWTPQTAGPVGHVAGVAGDRETMDGFLATIADREPHFAVVNLSEVDRTAHARGPGAVDDARRHADAALGRLLDDLRARGRWTRSVVVVTSDHGFDDVAPPPTRVVDLTARFAADGIRDLGVVSDGGVAHVYGSDADALARAAGVARRDPGVADVLGRVPVPGVPLLGASHPEWGLDHPRTGALLVVARRGFHFVDSWDRVGRGFRGDHGGPGDARVPLVIAGGALARPACRFDSPPSAADLGATIATLLGLRAPRRFDGAPVRSGRPLPLPLRWTRDAVSGRRL